MAATARSGAAALPVRHGERRWTEAELAKIRDTLAAEIADLHAEIDKAESEIADRLGDAVGDAGDDQADAGAKTFEREQELALTHRSRELLAQVVVYRQSNDLAATGRGRRGPWDIDLHSRPRAIVIHRVRNPIRMRRTGMRIYQELAHSS